MTIKFKKMHGLGNDFAIFDLRDFDIRESREKSAYLRENATAIADRHRGIGCDQLIILEGPTDAFGDMFMIILNPDGSEAGACGNATRCVAWLEMGKTKRDIATVETIAGHLSCRRAEGDNRVMVDMGVPKIGGEQELPFGKGICADVGNPHCVFFVEDIEAVDVAKEGPAIETHLTFPDRTNVEFVQVVDQDHLRMRVWERGVGITQACGSGACAAAVAAIHNDFTNREVTVTLDGGDLVIAWPDEDAQVSMTGPVAYVFDGVLAE